MYQTIASHAKSSFKTNLQGKGTGNPGAEIGDVIRKLREDRGQRATQLAKRAGIDPRTFAAIEKGRIKNPSLQNLRAIASALGVSPADFFYLAEATQFANLYHGSSKGEFSFQSADRKFHLVSFTPLIPYFFIGKVVMQANARIKADALPVKGYIFLQVILGKLSVTVNEEEHFIKEGEHFLLNGRLPHQFVNSAMRESAFLLVTVPSFLGIA